MNGRHPATDNRHQENGLLALPSGCRVPDAESHSSLVPWGPPPPYRPPSAAERAALARVYDDVDAALAADSRACRACGKCCRFEPGGIVLFASAMELAYLVSESGRPSARSSSESSAPESWRCPYQDGDRCTARRGRTLGCRTYFCDDAARARGERIHAEALARIKAIAGPEAWWYGPARTCLEVT